jgi:hypothetical protein
MQTELKSKTFTEITKIESLYHVLQKYSDINCFEPSDISQLISDFKSMYRDKGSNAFLLRYLNDALSRSNSKKRFILYSSFSSWISRPVSGIVYQRLKKAFTVIFQEMDSENKLKDSLVLNASNMAIGDVNWRWLTTVLKSSSMIRNKRVVYLDLSNNDLDSFVLREILEIFAKEKSTLYVNLTYNNFLKDLTDIKDELDDLSDSSLIFLPIQTKFESPIVITSEQSPLYPKFDEFLKMVEKVHPSYYLKPDEITKRCSLHTELEDFRYLEALIMSLIDGQSCRRNLYLAWKLYKKLDKECPDISKKLQSWSVRQHESDISEEEFSEEESGNRNGEMTISLMNLDNND